MFANFTNPADMSAVELSLMAQNQFLIALSIVFLLLFLHEARKSQHGPSSDVHFPKKRIQPKRNGAID
ncbi:MAG: hypothetical protein AAF597_16095 [Bacteroidota bacterium]